MKIDNIEKAEQLISHRNHYKSRLIDLKDSDSLTLAKKERERVRLSLDEFSEDNGWEDQETSKIAIEKARAFRKELIDLYEKRVTAIEKELTNLD